MSTDLEDRVRAALAHRAEHTTVGSAGLADVVPASRRRPGSPRAWLTVAAAVVMLVAGLVAFETLRVDDAAEPPATPSPTTVMGPLALDLDSLRTGPAPVPSADHLIVDAAALPAGWSLSDASGFTTLTFDGSPFGSIYRARLHGPDGRSYDVSVSSPPQIATEPAGSGLAVDGRPAVYENSALRWQLDDDHTVTLVGAPSADSADALAAAQALRWTTGVLPVEPVTGAAQLGDDTRLAGTLDGVGWVADVDPGPLRTIYVSIGSGGGATSGIENDRLSQPDDSPQSGVSTGIAAAPGHGGVVFGIAPPAVAAVRVQTGDTTIAVTATYQRAAESYFAVPVPGGLTVSRLELVDGTGAVVGSVTIPELPPLLGGGYGGLH
ncbi:MAG: hypothetical protein QM733_06005 [Ilumatobacteraceae bacterium]